MKKFGSYEKVEAYQETVKLPPGGYVIGILDAEEKTESWGAVLEIKFDISEGEYKNHFSNQYKNSSLEDKRYKGVYRLNIPKDDGSEQDIWTARRFKTDITAIEASNSGFHWDWEEKKLVGKTVGAVFFSKEYDYEGKRGFFTALHGFRDTEKIRKGDFKIPEPKTLKNQSGSDFKELNLDESELPFK